jgi:hypothetical protein
VIAAATHLRITGCRPESGGRGPPPLLAQLIPDTTGCTVEYRQIGNGVQTSPLTGSPLQHLAGARAGQETVWDFARNGNEQAIRTEFTRDPFSTVVVNGPSQREWATLEVHRPSSKSPSRTIVVAPKMSPRRISFQLTFAADVHANRFHCWRRAMTLKALLTRLVVGVVALAQGVLIGVAATGGTGADLFAVLAASWIAFVAVIVLFTFGVPLVQQVLIPCVCDGSMANRRACSYPMI